MNCNEIKTILELCVCTLKIRLTNIYINAEHQCQKYI